MDPAQPTVECIVVHKQHIVDRGSLADVRKRWGDMDTIGPVPGAPQVVAKKGLKVKFLKTGEAAYPGFVGGFS